MWRLWPGPVGTGIPKSFGLCILMRVVLETIFLRNDRSVIRGGAVGQEVMKKQRYLDGPIAKGTLDSVDVLLTA